MARALVVYCYIYSHHDIVSIYGDLMATAGEGIYIASTVGGRDHQQGSKPGPVGRPSSSIITVEVLIIRSAIVSIQQADYVYSY